MLRLFRENNWAEIDRYMGANKIKFLLELMFKTFPDKLIGGKVLPVKMIPTILKTYGISEKDFDLEDLLLNYHWVQHHDSGLTFEDFFKGSVLFKMHKNNWKSIETFLRKIDIKKYV
jgi:hypothetical protein